MLNKRLEISHVCEKRLQNCFDLETGAISSACPEIYPKNWKKRVMSIFSKTVFVVTKIFRIWTMGVITFYTHILMSLVKFSGRLVLFKIVFTNQKGVTSCSFFLTSFIYLSDFCQKSL